jgi:hypothetical protein
MGWVGRTLTVLLQPLQPPNVEPPDGVAVSVTEDPDPSVTPQSEPQLMPGPVTVPLPVPVF